MRRMHYKIARFAVTLLLILSVSLAKAATYYFSSSQGDDSRSMAQAQNPATPFRSIDKLNAIFASLSPGDVISFQRGETFEGTINITKSGVSGNPITFTAHGSGARPVISSFGVVGNWSSVGNGVWEARFSSEATTLNMVTINNVAYAMGRYPNSDAPNKGYLTMENFSGNTSLTDNQLSSWPNWTGAEVVIRKNRWIIDRDRVTNHSGTTISYSSASSYSPGYNHGYFIQGHSATLDKFGEWYYNKSAGTLRVFFGNDQPSNYQVRASRKEQNVAINRNNFLSFDNLSFQGSNRVGFDLQHTTGISITNSEILFSGTDAIIGVYTNNFRLENSTIAHTFSNAIGLLTECHNIQIRNNQVKNTGYFIGMGKSGDQTYQAIFVIGNNSILEGNKVEVTGGNPFTFRGNNALIRNNFADNFSFVKDDGGGIYTWNNGYNAVTYTNQKVLNNIILNGIGAPEGTPNLNIRLAKGIFLDDNSANVEIAGNTVNGCSTGMYIRNSNQVNVHNNLFTNNKHEQVVMTHDNLAPTKPIRGITFRYNILSTKEPSQQMLVLNTKDNDIGQFGTFDNNFYTKAIAGNIDVVTTVTGLHSSSTVRRIYNLNAWKAVFGFESSSFEPLPGPHYVINSIIGGNKYPNRNFDSNINGVYNYSPAGNLQTNWDNTNKLEGGSLRASFSYLSGNTGVTLVRTDIGAVDASKKYIMRFSVIGAKPDRTLKVSIQNKFVSTQNVVSKSFKSTTTRNNYEFLFEPDASLSTGVLHFEIGEQDGTVWFDNVELYEANVSIDPEYVQLQYNASNSQRTVSLNGVTFRNGKGEIKSGSITLAPYGSEILMKQLGSTTAPTEPAPTPTPTPTACSGTGGITREYWANVSGNSIGNIPVNSAPTSQSQLSSFEASTNVADNYGQRIRGYICAPTSGDYTFYIAGDDDTELWLSTDGNVANRRRIASISGWTNAREWTKFSSQRSGSVYLQQGIKYYIEVLHKEGTGGDNLAVGWTVPNTSAIAVIPGANLIPFTSTTSPAPAPAPTACSGTGGITREYWANVSGDLVSAIPVNTTPSSRSQLGTFETPANAGDTYGQRIRGYICAPTSGNYTFYIAGDDNSELWLSTDGNVANRRRIASVAGWTNAREWTKYASQQSATIYLQQGTRYYIEALHKEGWGGDNLAVGWTVPNNSAIAVIPGANLIPFTTNARLAADEISLEKERDVTAYPNPFEDKLYLRAPLQGELQISLIDALGRVCYSAKQVVHESELEIDLSQTTLKTGVYFVKLQGEGSESKIIRVVKK